MKFVGGVFITMLAVVVGCTGIGMVRYAQPVPLLAVSMLSGNASPAVQQQAGALVGRYQGISFYPSQAVDLVKQSVPALKKVVAYRQGHGYRVSLTQQKPVCLINTTQVLTHDGQCVHKDLFTSSAIEQLFAYAVTQQDSFEGLYAQDHVRFARTFDSDVLRDYTVTWIDWSRIELADKQDASMCLIVSADMPLQADLFKVYQEVKKEIKSFPVGKKGRTWQVDMRFKNQILVC